MTGSWTGSPHSSQFFQIDLWFNAMPNKILLTFADIDKLVLIFILKGNGTTKTLSLKTKE